MNIVLGVAFAIFTLYWGVNLVAGGYSAAQKVRAPKEEAPPPAAAPAAAVATAPAAPAKAEAAPAATANPSLPLAEITIKPGGASGLEYDIKALTVKSGQKVKLTFANIHPIPQPHNWILVKPGAKDTVLAAAMAAMTDPKALEKGFVPTTPDILHYTKLVQPGASDTIEFVAPAPGDYPYLCTFPGHGALMNGVMKVE